jgi:hypothetical protein
MSGGGIGNQGGDDDRQVVIFTFSGALNPLHVEAWNNAIGPLLTQFDGKLTGVTLKDVGGRNPKRKT